MEPSTGRNSSDSGSYLQIGCVAKLNTAPDIRNPRNEMPNWEYKAIEWDKNQEEEPGEIIENETNGTDWDFHASVDIHAGRADLIFRRRSGN